MFGVWVEFVAVVIWLGFCLLCCGLLHCFGLYFVSLVVVYCLWVGG